MIKPKEFIKMCVSVDSCCPCTCIAASSSKSIVPSNGIKYNKIERKKTKQMNSQGSYTDNENYYAVCIC